MTAQSDAPQKKSNILKRIVLFLGRVIERIFLALCGIVSLAMTVGIVVVETITYLLLRLIHYKYPYWFTKIFGAIGFVGLYLAFDK